MKKKKIVFIIFVVIQIIVLQFSLTACAQSVDAFSEEEHIQRISERIEKRFMTGQTDYTSFTVYPLYSQDEKLTCFLVEFEPCLFFFVGFNPARSLPFRSMYRISATEYWESHTWSPYTVDETNSQPFPETDKCYKVDENGNKICYSKSPYSVTQNLDKKKYLIETEDGYIFAIKNNDLYINLISLTEIDISKGDLEKKQATLCVNFIADKRFDLF